jgi:hypothetical protein
MGLRDIVNIIRNENLCANWDLDDENDNLLSLYYDKFHLHFSYDEGKLVTIFHMKIYNKNIREKIKRKYEIEGQRAYDVFIYQNDFYIQTIYKRFTRKIIWDYSTFYSDIKVNMILAKNDKKYIILYPFYNINEEREPRLNYPILDSELL